MLLRCCRRGHTWLRHVTTAAQRESGAYGVPGLQSPASFRVLAEQAERRCVHVPPTARPVSLVCMHAKFNPRRVEALVAELQAGRHAGEAAVEALDDVSDAVRVCCVTLCCSRSRERGC